MATVSGLFGCLNALGLIAASPVPRGLATRHPGRRGVPLIRAPRLLPRVLTPREAAPLLTALCTFRDRATVELMLLAGLRRGEVLGLALADVRPGERRVFVAEGKGGSQRIVPIASPTPARRRTLRTPVGKMPTDRYAPLHPAAKTLIDDWVAQRADWQTGDLLFTDRRSPTSGPCPGRS